MAFLLISLPRIQIIAHDPSRQRGEGPNTPREADRSSRARSVIPCCHRPARHSTHCSLCSLGADDATLHARSTPFPLPSRIHSGDHAPRIGICLAASHKQLHTSASAFVSIEIGVPDDRFSLKQRPPVSCTRVTGVWHGRPVANDLPPEPGWFRVALPTGVDCVGDSLWSPRGKLAPVRSPWARLNSTVVSRPSEIDRDLSDHFACKGMALLDSSCSRTVYIL